MSPWFIFGLVGFFIVLAHSDMHVWVPIGSTVMFISGYVEGRTERLQDK